MLSGTLHSQSEGKSQARLLGERLKRINTLDKDTRYRLVNLETNKYFKAKNQKQGLLESSKLLQIQQALKGQTIYKPGLTKFKATNIRADIIREEVHLRKKLYDDVFFRKAKRNYKPKLTAVRPKSNNQLALVDGAIRIKTQGAQSSPLMLRKRNKKLEKQLSIIRTRYHDAVKDLEYRKVAAETRVCFNQKDMLRRIKGTMMYYRMLSSWEAPP